MNEEEEVESVSSVCLYLCVLFFGAKLVDSDRHTFVLRFSVNSVSSFNWGMISHVTWVR